jgi:chemotaxis signal transduction protein
VETSQTGEYLTFRVARQDFAMLTSRVRGILPAREMIHIDAPEFSTSRPAFVTAEFSNSAPGFSNSAMICGVASLRGRDFPVVDLRGKLGIAHGSHGRQPCLIVVEAGSGSGARLIGFVADRISEVLMLRDRDFRKGSVRVNGRSRRVLDPDLILTDEELARCWNASLLPIR